MIDTSLNVVLPEKRIKSSYYPLPQIHGCDLQSLVVQGSKIVFGYASSNATTGQRLSFYVMTDLDGNVIKEDTLGIAPPANSIVTHELAQINPYPNNRYLATGRGLIHSSGSLSNSHALYDSNMTLLDTFYFKPDPFFSIGAYSGNYAQTPNVVVLPSGNIVVGRDYYVQTGPNHVGGILPAFAKSEVSNRFAYANARIFTRPDSVVSIYNSSPSLRNLEYNVFDNRLYYAAANFQTAGYIGVCLPSQNFVQIICTDTNLNLKWRKYLSPNPNSCARITQVAVSDRRSGFNVLGQFVDATNQTDTALQGAFLFHVDSAGSLDIDDQRHFTIRDRFKIYPNPASTVIAIDDVLNDVREAALYNMQGTLVKRFTIAVTPVKLNLPHVTPGIYFFRLLLRDGSSHIETVDIRQ